MKTIDITGADGNAFALLGYANKFGKQMGMSSNELKAIQADMMSDDYEHLLKVFIKHFGLVVKIDRGEDEDDD